MTISKENLDIATNLVGEWAFRGTPVHERLIRAIAQSLQEKDTQIRSLKESHEEVFMTALEEAAKIARGSLCSCCSPQDPERCIPEAEEIASAIEKLRIKNGS